MPALTPRKMSGIAGCRLKGIPLSWEDVAEYGCADPQKQWHIVCKYFDYHGGKPARKCYPAPRFKGRCSDRDLISSKE